MHKSFEHIVVGDQAAFSRTITEEDVNQFVKLTGDDNPLHIDPIYALKTSYKKPVVHGMLTASFISTMVGKHLPGPGALWMSQNLEFCLPVRLGDDLEINAVVAAKQIAQRILFLKMEIKNQHGQIILKGEGKVKMLKLDEEQQDRSTPSQKITLITGASRGIGAETAAHLAKIGHWVVINYNNSRSDAEALVKAIENAGGKAIAYQADVSDPEAVQSMVNYTEKQFGQITGLVCNATNKLVTKDFDQLSWEDIEKNIDVQLKGTFNCVKAVLPHFKVNKSGSTVVVGSIATDNTPPAKMFGYAAAKSALHSLTKSLALEYGPAKIRFNVISPGMTETSLIADMPEKVKLLTSMQTPLRRLAKPKDIAQAIAFLLNDESAFISGENLRVCGGQVML